MLANILSMLLWCTASDWLIYCLYFCDVRLLNTILVSSKFPDIDEMFQRGNLRFKNLNNHWQKEKNKQWSKQHYADNILTKEKDKQWSTQHYTDNILTKRKGQTMIYTALHRQYIDQKKRTNNDLHNTTQTIYWPK
jgi:hypothetical protein